MKKTITIIAIFLLFTGVDIILGNEGSIDWIHQRISTRSVSVVTFDESGNPVDHDKNIISLNKGRTLAYDRARERSIKKITGSILNIKVDPENTLRYLIDNNDTVQASVSRIIEESIMAQEYPAGFDRSGCRAILRFGDLIRFLPYRYLGNEFPLRTDSPASTDYSGLIIDTRGTGVTPMLLPSIYNEYGLEIYGKNLIDIKSAYRNGAVGYVFTEDEAKNHVKAGDRPFFTVGLTSLKGCPVLADRDVKKLFSSKKTLERLKKCSVIFIIERSGTVR